MSYQIIRYIADKPTDYDGGKLLAKGSIQYSREDKNQAEQILTRLYEMSANQKTMQIQKRTRYTFKCENSLHKYFFKVAKGDKKNPEDTYL